jgi:hypothetical protein
VVTTATIAVTIGSSMAITDPKASSRMRTAARMPSASLFPNCGFSIFSTGAPPTCTANPGPAARWAWVMTCRIAASGRASPLASNRTRP